MSGGLQRLLNRQAFSLVVTLLQIQWRRLSFWLFELLPIGLKREALSL
jgi:hypothetical protein